MGFIEAFSLMFYSFMAVYAMAFFALYLPGKPASEPAMPAVAKVFVPASK